MDLSDTCLPSGNRGEEPLAGLTAPPQGREQCQPRVALTKYWFPSFFPPRPAKPTALGRHLGVAVGRGVRDRGPQVRPLLPSPPTILQTSKTRTSPPQGPRGPNIACPGKFLLVPRCWQRPGVPRLTACRRESWQSLDSCSTAGNPNKRSLASLMWGCWGLPMCCFWGLRSRKSEALLMHLETSTHSRLGRVRPAFASQHERLWGLKTFTKPTVSQQSGLFRWQPGTAIVSLLW